MWKAETKSLLVKNLKEDWVDTPMYWKGEIQTARKDRFGHQYSYTISRYSLKKCKKPCLIVIDAQNKYLKWGRLALCIDKIVHLVKGFRDLHLPVFFTRYDRSIIKNGNDAMNNFYGTYTEERQTEIDAFTKYQWDQDENMTSLDDIHESLAATPEAIFPTTALTAFSNLNLKHTLKQHQFDTIFLCGGWTNMCVTASAFDAFNRNYNVCIVEDACFASAACKEVYKEVLGVLESSIALVKPTSSVLTELEDVTGDSKT